MMRINNTSVSTNALFYYHLLLLSQVCLELAPNSRINNNTWTLYCFNCKSKLVYIVNVLRVHLIYVHYFTCHIQRSASAVVFFVYEALIYLAKAFCNERCHWINWFTYCLLIVRSLTRIINMLLICTMYHW